MSSEIVNITDELELRRRYLFRICETKQELHDWVFVFLGLDIPAGIVHPDSNSSPMDMIWEMYSEMLKGDNENFMRVLYYASRDSFKTLGAAVIEVIAVLHCNRNVAHMAAIQDQAKKAQEYAKRAFRRPYIRDFVVGDNERSTKLVRFYNPSTQHSLTVDEYLALSQSDKKGHVEIAKTLEAYVEKENYIKIVVCTMAGSNSEHVPLFVVDEVDVVANPAAYAEAQNIPAGKNGMLPITMLTSTRKHAFGLVQKEIDRSRESGMQIRHWNIIDVTQRCLPSRHKPELPKIRLYSSDEHLKHVSAEKYADMPQKEKESYIPYDAFAGCATCKLFPACKTRLVNQTDTSAMLKTIPETIGKFRANSIEMAKAQLLCTKPSTQGLVYSRFDRSRHVIPPHKAYEIIKGETVPNPTQFSRAKFIESIADLQVQWYAGIDWGHTHNFCYIHGFKYGGRFFVTGCITINELDPAQTLEAAEPYKHYNALVYADTADPKMVKLFKKHGWRMQSWKKDKVVPGINTVRWLMSPMNADIPNLFFVHDIEQDQFLDIAINNISQYHWKVDAANKPTEIPSETDDDEADALRYLLVNAMKIETQGVVTAKEGPLVSVNETPVVLGIFQEEKTYDANNWMQQLIQEHSGGSSYDDTTTDKRPDTGILWDI